MTEGRGRTIAIASGLGMTRREIGELLGLSAGRVQQVLEDLPPRLRSEVDHLLRDVLKVLRHLGSRSSSGEDLARSSGIDSNAIDELISLDLLRQDGALISVSDAGEQAELHLRTSKRRASAGHA
jgi:biotin operon repressor